MESLRSLVVSHGLRLRVWRFRALRFGVEVLRVLGFVVWDFRV